MMNLLGLPEFRVLKVEESDDGISLTVYVENEKKPECLLCGSIAPMRPHGINHRVVQDAHIALKLVYLDIAQRRYLCPDCGHTFTENVWCVTDRNRMTDRLRDEIKRRCLMDTFTRIANDYSISGQAVRDIFDEYVADHQRDMVFDAPEVLGLDEAHLALKMRAVITDIKNRKLLDILPNRDSKTLISYFRNMRNRYNVEVVAIDMYNPYRLVARESFTKPIVVVDKYHVVALVTKAMDQERIRISKDLTKEERRDLLGCKDILASNERNLTSDQKAKLAVWLKRFPRLAVAYRQKENFLQMYSSKSRKSAEKQLANWCASVPSGYPYFQTVKNTVTSWGNEIVNYFDVGHTNAFTENRNGVIKAMQERGKGYTFEILRAKALFASHERKFIKFRRSDATFHESASFHKGFVAYDGTYTPIDPSSDTDGILVDGWGVDIDEVMSHLNSPEW